MKPPLFVRTLTAAERQDLRAGLRSADAFTVRRRQILLAGADGLRPAPIARNLSCARGTVRDAIHAFHAEGPAGLQEKSSRPPSARTSLDDRFTGPLKDLRHHRPRPFGKPTGSWTWERLAEVCHDRGWTPRRLTGEAVRVALERLGIRWRRAQRWITGPDPAYARKEKPATA